MHVSLKRERECDLIPGFPSAYYLSLDLPISARRPPRFAWTHFVDDARVVRGFRRGGGCPCLLGKKGRLIIGLVVVPPLTGVMTVHDFQAGGFAKGASFSSSSSCDRKDDLIFILAEEMSDFGS